MSLKHLKQGDALPPVKPDVLRVYSMHYCPFAQRALLVLAAKGIDHEIVNCNLAEKPEFLLERNPAGQVPVLEYQRNVIQESLVVSELIDELFPDKPLSAKDPYQKAKDKIVIGRFGPVTALHYKLSNDPSNEEAKKALIEALVEFQKLLTARETKFFGGDTCGMVDLMVWPWIERIMLLGNALDGVPDIKAWATRMISEPAIKAVAVPKEDMLRFSNSCIAGKPAYDVE